MSEDRVGAFLARFRRITTSGAFLGEIDGLRFIAIGTVVLYHLRLGLIARQPTTYAAPEGNLLAAVIDRGFHGVELFFIISGFILALPFANHLLKGAHPVRLKQYFLRRLTRLEPPYMICMILMFVLLVLVKGKTIADLAPHLAASLLYAHNLVFGEESLVNNVAWSLEIEIQFYILVPLISAVFAITSARLRRTVLIAAVFVSVAGGALLIGPQDSIRLSILNYLHFFLLGFLLADLYVVTWSPMPETSRAWDLVSLVGWPLLCAVWISADTLAPVLSFRGNLTLDRFLFPALAFLLYVAAFRGRVTNRIITNRWIATIGGMCYTIYLFHNPVMGVIMNATSGFAPLPLYEANLAIQTAIVVPLMLIPCGLYFLLIEKPCMDKDWPQKLYARLRRGWS